MSSSITHFAKEVFTLGLKLRSPWPCKTAMTTQLKLSCTHRPAAIHKPITQRQNSRGEERDGDSYVTNLRAVIPLLFLPDNK